MVGQAAVRWASWIIYTIAANQGLPAEVLSSSALRRISPHEEARSLSTMTTWPGITITPLQWMPENLIFIPPPCMNRYMPSALVL